MSRSRVRAYRVPYWLMSGHPRPSWLRRPVWRARALWRRRWMTYVLWPLPLAIFAGLGYAVGFLLALTVGLARDGVVAGWRGADRFLDWISE